MDALITLGHRVDQTWRSRAYAPEVFAEVAQGVVGEFDLPDTVDLQGILAWMFARDARTPLTSSTAFGEPAIRVFETDKFFVELIFWLDGTTAIHQHAFAGAFRVLAGSSIHSQYSFEEHTALSEHLHIGRLTLLQVEILRQGATRKIEAGRGFIHALFHLDRPSISLVVRTPRDERIVQFGYLRSGVAFDPFLSSSSYELRRDALRMLQQVDGQDRFELMTREVLRSCNFDMAFMLVRDLLSCFPSASRAESFVRSLASGHTLLVPPLLEFVRERYRESAIISLRGVNTNREQRLFLAMLMNVPDKLALFQLLRTVFPEANPVEKVMDWLEHFSMSEGGETARLAVLDPAGLAVARALLEGVTDAQLIEHLRREHDIDPDAESMLLEASRGLRRSLVLGGLFCGQERSSALPKDKVDAYEHRGDGKNELEDL